METPLIQTTTLDAMIRDLLYVSLRAHNIRDDDAVSLKTLKLMLVGKILDCYGIDWPFLLNHSKTHTPVHPDIVKELQQGDDEANHLLAQKFVRNEKLMKILKLMAQNGKQVSQILAVDGLGGPSGLNFEPKHYIGNLRYGCSNDDAGTDNYFDKGPDCKRLHVQTVRHMYTMLDNVPVPEKQVYEILRQCFDEMARMKLPKLELEEHEVMDENLQDAVGRFYMNTMGQENILLFLKSGCVKKFRGEKRNLADRDETNGKDCCEKQKDE